MSGDSHMSVGDTMDSSGGDAGGVSTPVSLIELSRGGVGGVSSPGFIMTTKVAQLQYSLPSGNKVEKRMSNWEI